MTQDAGSAMKARMRDDLKVAMKAGAKNEATLLRELIAALDNAEAMPAPQERVSLVRHEFHSRSAEGARRVLDQDQVRAIILAEIEERERAAQDLETLDETARVEELRAAALIVKRYIAR